MKTVTLFLLLFLTQIHAAIFDHLKPVENKDDGHSMRNIDFIYMINLDHRPEKYQMTMKKLEAYGIFPFRFSAVNGWQLSREVINDIGVVYTQEMEGDFPATYFPLDPTLPPNDDEKVSVFGRTYFAHTCSQGIIGCVLSHLSVLKDAYDSGYETIWIMEDDIDLLQNPHLISELIDKLDTRVGKNGWDILFTDRDSRSPGGEYIPALGMAKRPDFHDTNSARFFEKRNIDRDFRQIGARFGSYSMILRRSGIEKILDFYAKYQMFLPYDMDNYLPEGMRMFTVRKDVVSNLLDALNDTKEDITKQQDL